MENNNQHKQEKFLQKVKTSNFWKYSKLITGSATFALLLSIAFFVYETIDSKINNDLLSERLENVNNSLSTRYLGLFPHYIKNTNIMLRDALEKKEDFSADTIIIFEDVLYYGITSDPLGFIEVNDKLFQLADRGAKVFVVYYNTQTSLAIKNLRELLYSQQSYGKFVETQAVLKGRSVEYQNQLRSIMYARRDSNNIYSINKNIYEKLSDSLANVCFSDIIDRTTFIKQVNSRQTMKDGRRVPPDVLAETILNEMYFDTTRSENPKAFKEMIDKYRRPIVNKKTYSESITRQQYQETIEMCKKIDTLRSSLMEQPYDSIRFEHFVQMFNGYTNIMEREYSYHRNITLIPIEDYLSMSCWLIGNGLEGFYMIIAFPSRYSSDEIGFASQDDNIARYIHTMLFGILANKSKS